MDPPSTTHIPYCPAGTVSQTLTPHQRRPLLSGPPFSLLRITEDPRELWFKWITVGSSLVVQWLRLSPSSEGGMSLIPCPGARISQATQGVASVKK